MSPTKLKEGLFKDEEGKGKGYNERISDQQEIKVFTDRVFKDLPKQRMDYKQYEKLNKQQSSEMFYSIMAILHERLPCSLNYFRMRRKFKEAHDECQSPIRSIASPKIIKTVKGVSPQVQSPSHNGFGDSNMIKLSLKPTERFGGDGAKDRVSSPAKLSKTNKLRLKIAKDEEEEKIEPIMANEKIGFGIRVQKMN